jgi:cytosine/adenosine deaminase-related metal-dependent hydrolase
MATNFRRQLVRAAGVYDGAQVAAAPGALLIESGRIAAAGTPESIGSVPDADRIDYPDAVIIPGLVNAHVHLDLTHLGPIPFTGSFRSWVGEIRAGRARTGEEITASVRQGVALSRAGGVSMVGDIAGLGSLTPSQVMAEKRLSGVSFVEFFAMGRGRNAAAPVIESVFRAHQEMAAAGSGRGVTLGLQPHAPYSCNAESYGIAAATGLPLSTHLSETLEEVEFVEWAAGPLAEMLKDFGLWDESIRPTGRHPVPHIVDALAQRPCIAAHVNYLDDEHIDMLASACISVAYCPRAAANFGHPHAGRAPHRYREMLDRGLNVCIGTDGVPCLNRTDRLTPIDDIALLIAHDGGDPTQLLQMATTNGAIALGVSAKAATLCPDNRTGAIAVDAGCLDARDPLRSALSRPGRVEWVLAPRGEQPS